MSISLQARGIAPSPTFALNEKARLLRAKGEPVINLGIGSPDFRTPDNIIEAGKRAIDEGFHFYTPAKGLPELREAVAGDIRKYRGIEVDSENVLIVPGGKPTMFFAIMMFGEPGAEIMYPNPGFPIYESMIRFSGASPVPIGLLESNGFAFDPDRVLSQINENTRLIILNSPANPTGGILERDAMDRFVAGLEKHPHVALLTDEIYSRLLYDGCQHISNHHRYNH